MISNFCRVDTTLLIKVADFGLAGRILSKDYLRLDKDAGEVDGTRELE